MLLVQAAPGAIASSPLDEPRQSDRRVHPEEHHQIPPIPTIRGSPRTAALLDGVNAAALGPMAAVTWQLARTAVVDGLTAGIAVVAAAILLRFNWNSAWPILGGGRSEPSPASSPAESRRVGTDRPRQSSVISPTASAITRASSPGSTGFATCALKPAASARSRS